MTIQVDHFGKAYGDFVAVEDLSFTVAAGEILGLVGPNGAGKTTTIRTLCGIVPPSTGQIIVAGHDVVTAPIAAKRSLGYIPDDPRLFDTLTVWEHLAFSARAYRVDDYQDAAESLLYRFELTSKRDVMTHSLSRGMKQKVAIACAYLHHPQALLFDEPLTGLDPHGIRTIQESMRERAQAGAALIISSHLLSLVESLCTHLLVLHHGQSRLFGKMEDVLSRSHDGTDATLEEVFFAITHGSNSAPTRSQSK